MTSIYKEVFHQVTYKTTSNDTKKELFIGSTPEESLNNAKQQKRFSKGFKVSKTKYNTLGEKV